MGEREVRVRTWVRGSEEDVRTGLLGWIGVDFGNLFVDGIALRKSAEGKLILAFPKRKAGNGQLHAVVRPVTNEARIAIEREILAQLGQREGVMP
jgi:DNA-binding cell septation regulator SpoVG